MCSVLKKRHSKDLQVRHKEAGNLENLNQITEFDGHDCSYTTLSKDVKQECFSTKWGPVKFNKDSHPLSIMVGNSFKLNMILT